MEKVCNDSEECIKFLKSSHCFLLRKCVVLCHCCRNIFKKFVGIFNQYLKLAVSTLVHRVKNRPLFDPLSNLGLGHCLSVSNLGPSPSI
jgi:hypothetical protein